MRKLTDLKPTALTRELIQQQSIEGGVGQSRKHESAEKQVSGESVYIDDKREAAGQLHAAIGQSTIAHGTIKSIDLSAVKAAPGVVCVLTAEDVPGHIDIGPVFPGDSVLVKDHVEFYGQAIFAVAATSLSAARQAVKLAKIEYEALPAVLTIKEALAQENFVRPPHTHKRGNSEAAIARSDIQLQGAFSIGAQEHFYLEGQASIAEPTEDGGMNVYTSSQHPTEVQKLVAEVLDIPFNQVMVDVRRMGGGFGGKETNAAPWACVAALLAHLTKQSVKLRLPRADDMVLTGKRHPFENHYNVGFDSDGMIQGIDVTVNGNCGFSPDLSDAIVDRAMFHTDNAYYFPSATVTGNRCKTNTVSHTAFRGFGGPQGTMTIEHVIDEIARKVGKDPLDVRKQNLYGHDERNTTPYYQTIEHNILPEIIEQLEHSSDYRARRNAISEFNQQNPILKRGLALTPVKFGISFTVQHLNQAGALIHIYTDGSIQVNHGGTEMGQGLHTKIAQIVASEFQVDIDNIRVTATRTDKVPNTSPTAASSGTDLNGKAAQNAAEVIRLRLVSFLAEHFKVASEAIRFVQNEIMVGEQTRLSFAEVCQLAYVNRISLSSTGYYKTPKIHYDRESASGRPFFYYAMGAAVSEVIIDTLTGEYKVSRVDILHDVGDSINPAIDLGQIEGGFIQGMGWLTTEEMVWADDGRLLTTGPATYKIPAISDTPPIFNVSLVESRPNPEETIYHSKAVGEPPFLLAISVWSALKDAIASVADYQHCPQLDTPATPEKVLKAVQAMEAMK
jgi:xanthine dehydrogenase large subunit